MIDMYQLKDIGSKKLRQYMLNYLAIMMTVSSLGGGQGTERRKTCNCRYFPVHSRSGAGTCGEDTMNC